MPSSVRTSESVNQVLVIESKQVRTRHEYKLYTLKPSTSTDVTSPSLQKENTTQVLRNVT